MTPEMSKSHGARAPWSITPIPTLEFTTSIPRKGCVVDCLFCPQRLLTTKYNGRPMLPLDDFKRIVEKLPQEIIVCFAGFTEPWLNPQCTEMLRFASEKGHRLSVFTTGIGMKLDDVEAMTEFVFTNIRNGGFVLHLPDSNRVANHPITPNYIRVVEKFGELRNIISNFRIMAMGPIHESVSHVFPDALVPTMWSRAGNLFHEAILKPELANNTSFKSVYHGNEEMTCGCDEELYHNVVLPNGDVSLCCMDYGLDQILGNILEQSYESIVPQPEQCFDLCRKCENARKPKELAVYEISTRKDVVSK